MNVLAKFLRSQISGWIAVLLAVVLAGGVWYVQQIRVCCASCNAAKDASERIERLAGQIVDRRNEDLSDAVQVIEDAVDACLDRPADDLLRDTR